MVARCAGNISGDATTRRSNIYEALRQSAAHSSTSRSSSTSHSFLWAVSLFRSHRVR
jgi:hypothetical protein